MVALPTFITENELLSYGLGHLTYLLLVISMMMRDMVWLRTIAIGSAVLKIIYRLWFVPDPVAVFWESLFIAVNVGQLVLLWWLNARLQFTEHERQFISATCPKVSAHRARKLLKCGEWVSVGAGTVLTRQNEPVEKLIFIAQGSVEIARDGEVVAVCNNGDYLGEMSFITGKPATATATTLADTVYFAMDRDRTRDLMKSDIELRHGIEHSFNRNLVEKLAAPATGDTASHASA